METKSQSGLKKFFSVSMMLTLMLACAPAIAYSSAIISGYGYEDGNWFVKSSYAEPVRHYYPNITDHSVSGYADASTQTLRAYSRTESGGTGLVVPTESFIKTEWGNRLTIGTGTSGLSIGDPVTLRLSFSLDGNLGAGMPGCGILPCITFEQADSSIPIIHRNASVDAGAYYGIYSIDESTLAIRDTLMTFNYDSSLNYDAIADFELNAGIINEYLTKVWNLRSNTGDNLGDTYDNHSSTPYFSSGGTMVDIPPHFSLLTTDFNTFVGDTLGLAASMRIHSQAFGSNTWTSAYGDFLNTFGAAIDSPYISGLELSYDIPQQPGVTAPVPEPSSILLLASGVVVSLSVIRKLRKI